MECCQKEAAFFSGGKFLKIIIFKRRQKNNIFWCTANVVHSTHRLYFPLLIQGSECPPGVKVWYCIVDPCQVAVCPAHPTAQCVSNYCGGCNYEFRDGSGRVLDCTGKCALLTLDECLNPHCLLEG